MTTCCAANSADDTGRLDGRTCSVWGGFAANAKLGLHVSNMSACLCVARTYRVWVCDVAVVGDELQSEDVAAPRWHPTAVGDVGAVEGLRVWGKRQVWSWLLVAVIGESRVGVVSLNTSCGSEGESWDSHVCVWAGELSY